MIELQMRQESINTKRSIKTYIKGYRSRNYLNKNATIAEQQVKKNLLNICVLPKYDRHYSHYIDLKSKDSNAYAYKVNHNAKLVISRESSCSVNYTV